MISLYIFSNFITQYVVVFDNKKLESQVSELKKRLEDLCKAKSQTIIKKDKEYVSTIAPKLLLLLRLP